MASQAQASASPPAEQPPDVIAVQTAKPVTGPELRVAAVYTCGKVCQTPGCGQALARVKGIYCSQACYVIGCQGIGIAPRICNQAGCNNVSVPGEQGGARCANCYAAHKLGYRQAAGELGRLCAVAGCGGIVYGEKPKYGQFCSLDCGRASGQGRPCRGCGLEDVFKGSQSAKLCLECYNSRQIVRKRPDRSNGVSVEGEGGSKRKRKCEG